MSLLSPQLSVVAELEQGSVWDPGMLFSGVALVITAFASTFETDIWEADDRYLIPLLTIGVSLVLLNVFLRIIRPKLRVTLFEIQDDLLKICPVRNIQFSGWVTKKPFTVDISEISDARVYDFYHSGTNAGMYWICLEFKNGHVVEFNLDNFDLVKEIIEFLRHSLPSKGVTVDARIET